MTAAAAPGSVIRNICKSEDAALAVRPHLHLKAIVNVRRVPYSIHHSPLQSGVAVNVDTLYLVLPHAGYGVQPRYTIISRPPSQSKRGVICCRAKGFCESIARKIWFTGHEVRIKEAKLTQLTCLLRARDGLRVDQEPQRTQEPALWQCT